MDILRSIVLFLLFLTCSESNLHTFLRRCCGLRSAELEICLSQYNISQGSSLKSRTTLTVSPPLVQVSSRISSPYIEGSNALWAWSQRKDFFILRAERGENSSLLAFLRTILEIYGAAWIVEDAFMADFLRIPVFEEKARKSNSIRIKFSEELCLLGQYADLQEAFAERFCGSAENIGATGLTFSSRHVMKGGSSSSDLQRQRVEQALYQHIFARSCDLHRVIPMDSPGLCSPIFVPHSRTFACAPSFIVAGVPRAGTTSLFYTLLQHHNIQGPAFAGSGKEMHFWGSPFDPEKNHTDLDWERYIRAFPLRSLRSAADRMMYGEASPGYFYAARSCFLGILSFMPRMKFTVVFREPIGRALSEFRGRRQEQQLERFIDRRFHGSSPLTFSSLSNKVLETMAHCPRKDMVFSTLEPFGKLQASQSCYVNPFVANGRYSVFLDQNFQQVPPSQLIIMDSSQLMANGMERAIERLSNFLGLEPFKFKFDSVWNTAATRGIQQGGSAAQDREHLQPSSYSELPKFEACVLLYFFQPFNVELREQLRSGIGHVLDPIFWLEDHAYSDLHCAGVLSWAHSQEDDHKIKKGDFVATEVEAQGDLQTSSSPDMVLNTG